MNNSLFEFTCCPMCGSSRYSPKYRSRDLFTKSNGLFSLVKCSNCGLVRTQPRPIEACISNFYPSDYGPYKSNNFPKNNAKRTFQRNLLEKIKSFFIYFSVYPSRNLITLRKNQVNLLDYGCASGQFLLSLDKTKYKLYGIDFSDSALKNSGSRDLNLYCEPVPSNTFKTEFFDYITAWMVLEHLYDPLLTLDKLKSWLSEDGYLHLSVPDESALHKYFFKGLSYDNHVPQHLLHFNPKTISKLLRLAGFKVVSIRWQPNARTLLMSFRNLLELICPGAFPNAYMTFLESRLGSFLSFLLGYFLAIIRQSGRIEVIARKA